MYSSKSTNLKRYLFISIILLSACSRAPKNAEKPLISENENRYKEWTELAQGVEFIEMQAPEKSFLGDSKLSILRLEPEQLQFYMYNATQFNKVRLTAPEWADSFDLNIVMNAGMYDLANRLIHRGYLKNGKHYNNRKFSKDYNSMIAFSPIDSTKRKFDILDLECENWAEVCDQYSCYAQGMRMIDCNGEALGWNKKDQSCSMLVAAKDKFGRIWFVFSRSPYSHNQMISFLGTFKDELSNAIYLEGGPETSMYINIKEHRIEKVGSYVSKTFPTDSNTVFWDLPNVIGIRVK
jgi:hypothetical protein